MVCFKAGRLSHFEENWRKLTSDESVLDIALHCHIEIDKEVPKQNKYPPQFFNSFEEEIIEKEICKLSEMGVIEEVQPHEGQFISPIFTRPKKDGEYRMILNLKELNKSVEYLHFKMDTFEIALNLVKPDCFMASIDLRHAYYSVPIHKPHRRFLRFIWKDKIFQYTCFPNGIGLAPRKFTKLLKPVYAKLRQMGHSNSGYIDDSLLLADTRPECKQNVKDTVAVMTDLGFIIHPKKSVFEPTQDLVFLGNHINSQKMIVYLPQDRIQVIISECKKLRNRSTATIREVARVIGLIVASFSAVEYGQLFYRELEKGKSKALTRCAGDFNAQMQVTRAMHEDLAWWITNLPSACRKISHGNASKTITSDASTTGWGAICNGIQTGGRWTFDEMNHHINYLELLAICYALKSFCKNDSNIHVQLRTDSTTAVSYIKKFGGIRSDVCNKLAKQIWLWAMSKQIWLSATHIPGAENDADYESRHYTDNVEWMLDRTVAENVMILWDKPEIDMFASRMNKQLDRYVSWRADPEAEFVDAFAMSWENIYFYAFPPFSLISRLMTKLREDHSECILIAPIWLTQTWFLTVMEHLVQDPYILPVHQELLTIPGTVKTHPLYKRLILMICRLSGNPYKIKVYQKGLPVSSCAHGAMVPRNSTPCILKNGLSTVVKGRLIVFRHL